MASSLLPANPSLLPKVTSHLLSHMMVVKSSRKVNILALKLAGRLQHALCAGLGDVFKDWKEKQEAGDEALVHLNLAVAKKIAQNIADAVSGTLFYSRICHCTSGVRITLRTR